MATGSAAFGAKAGFNQSGGGLYITLVAPVVHATVPASSNVFKDPVVSGSGGSVTQPLPVGYTQADLTNYAVLAAVGVVIRDMGRTYQVPVDKDGVAAGTAGVGPIVAMRTFRKFQIVGNTATAEAAFGVVNGGPANLAGTFWLESMREGQELPGAPAPAQIARYF